MKKSCKYCILIVIISFSKEANLGYKINVSPVNLFASVNFIIFLLNSFFLILKYYLCRQLKRQII